MTYREAVQKGYDQAQLRSWTNGKDVVDIEAVNSGFIHFVQGIVWLRPDKHNYSYVIEVFPFSEE